MPEANHSNLTHNQTEQNRLLHAQNHYPQYYPAFILDCLWYITEENVAFRVVLDGASVVGINFFDMLFSPQARQMLGDDWHEHVSKDIRYFIDTTSEYQKEHHVFHEEYARTREHLAQLPGFDEMFSSLKPRPVDHSGKPFQAGTLYTQYRLSETQIMLLEFASMVQVTQDNPLEYRVTLVPSNQATKAGLTLMYLAYLQPIPEDVHIGSLQQHLWKLALLKTVEEGLTKANADINWEPVAAFNRIRNELDVEFSKLAEDSIDEAIARNRAIMERLDEDKILNKEALRDMVMSFTKNYEGLAQEDPDELSFSQAQEKLKMPCAFWLLTPQGNILAANLVATWLWEERQLNNKTFFGVNVFEIFNRSRARIPKNENDEFFRKKIPVLIRLVGAFGRKPYEPFLSYLDNYADLKEIFNKQEYLPDKEWESKRIWEYSLKLVPPEGTHIRELLEFKVTIYRLHPTNEFLGVYEPHPSSPLTQSLIREKYNQAIDVANAGMVEYIQYLGGKKEGIDLTVTMEPSPEIQPEVSNVREEVKVPLETQIDKYIAPYTVWETLRGWAKEAERREFKDIEVKGLEVENLDVY